MAILGNLATEAGKRAVTRYQVPELKARVAVEREKILDSDQAIRRALAPDSATHIAAR